MVGLHENCGIGGEVTTEHECRTAAQFLGRRFVVASNWPTAHPRYCFYHPTHHFGVYFNTFQHLAPGSVGVRRAICKRPGESSFTQLLKLIRIAVQVSA